MEEDVKAIHPRVRYRLVRLLCTITICLVAALTGRQAHAASLRIWYDVSDRPILPGDTVIVYIEMAGLDTQKAAGWQAFLEFDSSQMFLVGGNYTPVPFGLGILPIIASGNQIDLASGINVFGGQSPTLMDAVLVNLTFQATEEFCTPTVVFRSHDPPTRITDPVGDPVLPLELTSLEPSTCPPDIDPPGGDGDVDVFDLFELLNRWNEPVPSIADFNCDGEVDVFDLFVLLDAWGACP